MEAVAVVIEPALERALLIRVVEQRLLELFSEGKVAGTTHTCIGQELAAVQLAANLDPERDVLFSNHRCHGHFLAWSDDVEGLIAEVMGRRSGPCRGIGGSQHLFGHNFFSNGIQGGIVPVSAGLAFAEKMRGGKGIVAVCIGDGTLGEGVVYETLNMAVTWRLPLLIVLENNGYAQSTPQRETLAGNIDARASAFGMRTFAGSTWEYGALGDTLRQAVEGVRASSTPAFVRIDTYRLAAHSKGDDHRDPTEIAGFSASDPLNRLLASLPREVSEPLSSLRARVDRAVMAASAEPAFDAPLYRLSSPAAQDDESNAPDDSGTQLEAINRALRAWLAADERVILLGEDVRSPYGGAFKVTRGLSDECPERVFNAPISEAGIVGVGNGLALAGMRPIVEIMFGDFLPLCFDQLVNHAAKFRAMYAGKVSAPLVIRTPMGGGRGYGPTHSQNLEKHFCGVPGLMVLVLHGRAQIGRLYAALRKIEDPVLIIENKMLYRERASAALPAGYSRTASASAFAATVLVPQGRPDITIVAFGRMSCVVERAAALLREQEEIVCEIVLPLVVSPFDAAAVHDSVARTGRIIVVEEGAEGFDLGAEILALVLTRYREAAPLRAARIAARATAIPCCPELERAVLPDVEDVLAGCMELFDV